MKKEQIARICHEVNKAYCEALGDFSQVSWEEAEDWQKESAALGVDLHTSNAEAGPSASHESWMAQKVADGWVYGDKKDPELKTHPCLVPFDSLPVEQQAKDFIFAAIVKAINSTKDITPSVVYRDKNLTPIKYIGSREEYQDGTYGTNTVWLRGQTKPVETSKALLMLKHTDQYVLGEVEESEGEAMPEVVKKKEDDDSRQYAVDVINAMPRKAQVAEYAKKNFNMEIQDGKLYEMKAQAISLIDKFGIE